MGLFGRIFGRSGKQVSVPTLDSMVQMIHLMGVPSYVTILEKFPELGQVSCKQYDFFLNTAAISCALMGMQSKCSEAEYGRAFSVVSRGLLEKWGKGGRDAVLDCNEFVKASFSESGVSGERLETQWSSALGMWMVWNLFQKQPGDEESQLLSVLGGVAFDLGASYWNCDTGA